MTDLTKDGKILLALIYKDYLERTKSGISKGDAKMLGSAEDLQTRLQPTTNYKDFEETMSELGISGYIDNMWASNKIYFSQLENKTIIYMENKNINTLKAVIDLISKLK